MEIIKIYGGPGAGKTTKLLQIIMSELDKGLSPDRLMFTTHTNAGVNEGIRRAIKAGKGEIHRNDLLYFATIHALCNRFANSGRSLLKTEDEDALRKAMQEDGLTNAEVARSQKAMAYEQAVDKPLTDEELLWKFAVSEQAYKKYKASHTKFVSATNSILQSQLVSEAKAVPLPIDVAIIDEAQDITADQWAVLETFTRNCARLYVAGDVNQAIFGWAGADARLFLSFPCDREETLPITYRCTESVWRLVSFIHSYYPTFDRSPIPTECANKEQGFVRIVGNGELGEAFSHYLFRMCTSGKSVFLLATTSKRLNQYRTFLAESGIPYNDLRLRANGEQLRSALQSMFELAIERMTDYVEGGKFVGVDRARLLRKPVVDKLLQKLQWRDEQSWLDGCVDVMWSLILDDVAQLHSWYTKHLRAKYALTTAVRSIGKSVATHTNVTVSTVHRVKGAEADYVVYDMGEHPDGKMKTCNSLSQLQHLFVACSRARLGVTVLNTSGVRPDDGGLMLRDLVPTQDYHYEFSTGDDQIQISSRTRYVYEQLYSRIANTWFARSNNERDNSELD